MYESYQSRKLYLMDIPGLENSEGSLSILRRYSEREYVEYLYGFTINTNQA